MRAGLENSGVETVFANDICTTKAALYKENWGDDVLRVCDIRSLSGKNIPDMDLATASFPCTDLSLAGYRRGLNGKQSGLILDFLRILGEMGRRSPSTVVIENVKGFMTANNGVDWKTVISRLENIGYATDHMVINASAFVPQSRPRVFIVAHQCGTVRLPDPPPERSDLRLADVAERKGDWWPPSKLANFLHALSPLHENRVASYQRRDSDGFFGAFRRTRGGSVVWEVRADERAGALRTTRGGSAKQAVLWAGSGHLAVRWMNLTEYARLQGAENMRYNSVTPHQAMFALGDAVCVPVIEWLASNCLLPIMQRK